MSVELVISGRKKDLGGFQVARVLPDAKRRMVGPFIFFDEMGPAEFAPGEGIDVRPHPHIGLATVTYLFQGEMDHADSLGVHQTIRPGDVNWMTAGKGIVHSERTGPEVRASGQTMHGIQTWVALPEADQEIDPEFHHHGAGELPVIEAGGATLRLILGEAYGETSPVRTYSPIVYLHAETGAGARLDTPFDQDEIAVYLVSGAARVDGETLAPGDMAILKHAGTARVETPEASRAMILGGANIGPRAIEWNFVSASQDRIDQAKTDWRESAAKGFTGAVFALPPGEREHIPLPGDPEPGEPPKPTTDCPTT